MAIYFIKSAGVVKIGYSDQVEVRVKSIIRTLRDGGEYAGHMAGDRRVERFLHEQFRPDHEFGEWFRASDRLLSFIALVAKPDWPDSEPRDPRQVLTVFEEAAADECAGFIRDWLGEKAPRSEIMSILADAAGLSLARLTLIYEGDASSVTCGEYQVLRQASSLSLGGAAAEPALPPRETHREASVTAW